MLLIISYLVVVNNCYSEAPKADNFVVDVVVVVVVDLLVVTDPIIFSCGLKAVDFVVVVVGVLVVVVNFVVSALIVVSGHIIPSWVQ